MYKIFFILFIFAMLITPSFGFDFHFKKKKNVQKPKEKMVETKQEWEIEAQNVPLYLRELKDYKEPETDKTFYYPEPHYVFEKYNYPQGTREVNIEDVKNKLDSFSLFAVDKTFNYVAYSRFYFMSEFNQIYSDFFVEKLDSSKTRKRRLLDYIHNQQKRVPVISSGNKTIYKNLFNGLSLVDWSQDSKKVLFKEKVGSLFNGIYKTYLYVYFVDEQYSIKLDNFDEAIKNYFLDWQNIQLIKYRYDIFPLGFLNDNDNIVVSYCYALDNDNNKVFLGIWGYNLETNQTILISKKMIPLDISSNALYLKQVVD